MAGVMFYQNRVMEKYKNLLEQIDTITKTDTLYKTIIFTDSIPKYIKKTVIKTDTVFSQKGDTLKVELKKKEVSNTLIQNQDTLQYNLWMTGRSYEEEDYPSVDSINFKVNHQIINTTTIIEKPIEHKKSRWNVTVGVGTGYGVINKQADIYLGVTFGYKL